jgi:lipopolysaccharide/colanic/teichoic acid biosynthesis glycosyltransferase
MGSTSFSSAAPLGRVLPFPGRTEEHTKTRTLIIQHFEAVAGVVERVMDFCAVIVGLLLAYGIPALMGRKVCDPRSDAGLAASAGFALLMVLLLEKNGGYRSCVSLLAVRETERILNATLAAFSLGVPLLALTTKALPLAFLACALTTVPLALAIEKWQIQRLSKLVRRELGVMRRTVIVGTGIDARRVFSALLRSPKVGLDPIAFVDMEGGTEKSTIRESGYQHTSRARVIPGPITPNLLRQLNAAVLIALHPLVDPGQNSSMRQAAEKAGVTTFLTSGPDDGSNDVTEYLELDGVMLSYRTTPPEKPLYESAKRVLDSVFAAVSLLMALPVILAAWMAVKVTSPGPAIFRQQRVGHCGRLFEMYKFRTMYVDSERYARSPVCGQDPRITPAGRVLRHLCIDELPQLLNVLKGEMSLVGPRPEMPFIVAKYEAIHLKRLSVKPGITGLWQLSADRLAPIHENISYDLYWIEDCVEGLMRLMASHYHAPLNLGTEELVTIDQLVDMTCEIAGKRLRKVHALERPQGVRGRNSDNSRLRTVLGWEPRTPLRQGLEITYQWIEQELERTGRLEPAYA